MTPLTIAYIGDFSRSWNTEVHIASALQVNGHTVVRLDELSQQTWAAVASAPRDWSLILWTHSRALRDRKQPARAIARAQAVGLSVVGVHLDRWWGLPRAVELDDPLHWTRIVDVAATADGGNDDRWAELGVEHWWFPPGVHPPDCSSPTRAPTWIRTVPPVVFVGSWDRYPHTAVWPHRMALVEHLRSRGDVGFYPVSRSRPVRGQELTALYERARVVVGDSCDPEGRGCYWSDRIPETLGRGGFLVHSDVPGLGLTGLHPGEHLETYRPGDFDELDAIIDLALAHPDRCAEISAAGRAKVLTHHTYPVRLASVLERLDTEGRLRTYRRQDGELTVKHRAGVTARFHVRSHTTDGIVLDELWREDQYRLRRDEIEGRTVIDVGANIGAFSLWAAAAGASLVHAYEPAAPIREQLHRNLALNPGLAERVAVFADALSCDAEDVAVDYRAGYEGGTRTRPPDVSTPAASLVSAVTLGDALDALPDGVAGFVKIDCEGCEYPTFAAAEGADLERIERLVLEFHGPLMPHMADLPAGAFGDLIEFLAEYGIPTLFGRPSTGGIIYWKRHG